MIIIMKIATTSLMLTNTHHNHKIHKKESYSKNKK